MKKYFVRGLSLLTAMVLAVSVSACGAKKSNENTPAAAQEKTASMEDVKLNVINGALNASYMMGKESVKLVNGVFEKEAAPGSAAKIKTTVWEKPVVGDLNGDGKDDTALSLVQTPGGSGTFYYIAAAVKDANGEGFTGTNAILLGDRVVIASIVVDKGIITASYKDREKSEPMTAAPTKDMARKFKVENGTLKEIN